MLWIVTSVIFAFTILGSLLIGNNIRRETPRQADEQSVSPGCIAQVIAAIVAVIWALWTLIASIHTVDYGSVGIVYQFGSIVGQTGDGLVSTAPWQDLTTASIQTQRTVFEKLDCFSIDTQEAFVTVTLNYSVSPDAIQRLYRTVGPNWFKTIVEPRVFNFVKEATVKYQAKDLAPNREAIRSSVREVLRKELVQFSVNVDDLLIENITFHKEFTDALEQTQIAFQNALQEQQKVQQSKFRADQQIEAARGEAESIKLKADGQASANRAIAASLSPEVIQFQAVQKLGDNIQVVILPAGQGIILDPSSYLKPPQK